MRKLALFALGYAAAIACAVYFLPAGVRLPLGVVCIALVLALRRLDGEVRRRARIVLLGACVALFWLCIFDYIWVRPATTLDDKTVKLSATVIDWPERTDYVWQVDMRTDAGVKLRLSCDKQGENLVPGDRISTVAHCMAVRDQAGNTQLNYAAQGIFLRARAYGELTIERPNRVPLTLLPAYLTRQLKENIDTCFSSETAPLIKAIVTGDRSDCSNALMSTIRRTGLSHTTAVSGMHLSYLVGFLLTLLGKGKRGTCLLTIPLIVLVTVMAGCTPSITRAAVMLFLVQLAPLLGRESDEPTSLAAALLLLLVTDPYCVASVGLQLSFASMAGLMLFSEPIRDRILEWLCPGEKERGGISRLWNRTAQLLAGSLGATLSTMLFTTPLTAYYFGQFTLVAPLANLLVLWAVSLLFCGGLLLGVLWSCLPTVCMAGAPVVEWAARYMIAVVERLSRLPFASVPSGEPFYLLWVLFVYALILLAILLPGRKRIWLAVGAGCCTFALAVLLTNLSFYAGNMGVWVLDVGQGQSVLVRLGNNNLVLVDCGGDAADDAGDIAADMIQSLGRSHIDMLVVSHYHADHANGVPRLLERLEVDTVFLPNVEPDSPLREQIVQTARARGSRIYMVEEDVRHSFGDGQLSIYAPLGGEDVNELGLTVLCTQGKQDVLITGDMGAETELALLEHTQLPDVEVMVAGHHGSKYSNSQQLLEKVRPDIAVFSSGRYNTYGHPTPEAMERFQAVGAQLYRTDHMGTVRITANHAE